MKRPTKIETLRKKLTEKQNKVKSLEKDLKRVKTKSLQHEITAQLSLIKMSIDFIKKQIEELENK